MPAFPTAGLPQMLIEEIAQGPLTIEALMRRLKKGKHVVTLQGVYKALRKLRDQEIVFLQQGEVMMNLRWLHELEDFATLTKHRYHDVTGSSGHFLQLQDGDRITYIFKNPVQVDAFWNHVLYRLFRLLPVVLKGLA